jgi:riboflavin synthase
MFTGIVEEVGKVKAIGVRGDGMRIEIGAKKVLAGLSVDNSISVNGTCLTIVSRTQGSFFLDAVKETLRKTSLGGLRRGSRVNLERAVTLRQRLGGHLVLGHVDTTGTVLKRTDLKTSWMYTIGFPKRFRRYLIPVGSIAVDGVSLTVARLFADRFEVAIIPYTFENTIFQEYSAGSKVNLEFDIVGKYIESLLRHK